MKTRYQFVIPRDERTEFQSIVEKLTGIQIRPSFIHSDISGAEKMSTYNLSLTKYELLYLRLAIKGGTYIELEDQQEQTDNTRQMA